MVRTPCISQPVPRGSAPCGQRPVPHLCHHVTPVRVQCSLHAGPLRTGDASARPQEDRQGRGDHGAVPLGPARKLQEAEEDQGGVVLRLLLPPVLGPDRVRLQHKRRQVLRVP